MGAAKRLNGINVRLYKSEHREPMFVSSCIMLNCELYYYFSGKYCDAGKFRNCLKQNSTHYKFFKENCVIALNLKWMAKG